MYDFNYMMFWKRKKSMEAAKRSVVASSWGEGWMNPNVK